MKEIHTTAIIGMGALGMLYADQIASSLGREAVFFAADSDRAEKYRHMTFTVNGTPKHFRVINTRDCKPADLVIAAVKYNALSSALDTIAPCVGPDTTIISVMNGITSEEIIGERFGFSKVIHCIAQGMDAVKFGGDLTYTRSGELRIGIRRRTETAASETAALELTDSELSERLSILTHYFDSAHIAYTVEDDIMYRLWGKFMLNVGINQTCMAFETNYGGATTPGKPYDTMIEAMREVITLANAEGIPLTEDDLTSYVALVRTLSPEGMPSMRQDGVSRRPSEVEMFSGTVRRLAAKHGIPVPVNDWLYQKIKSLEAAY